jgi:hypothetical protein
MFRFIILFTVAGIIFPQQLLSQKKITFDYHVGEIPFKFNNPNYYNESSVIDGKILFTEKFLDTDNQKFYLYDMTSKNVDTIKIINKNSTNFLSNERIDDLCVNGRVVALVTSEMIHIFKYDSTSKSLNIVKSIENKYYVKNAHRLGNGFLFEISYNFHPRDSKTKNYWSFIDTNNFEIIKEYNPVTNNHLFGSFVNSWVSTFDNQIAHAHTDKYQIDFYDVGLSKIDSIYFDTILVDQKVVDSLQRKKSLSKSSIEALMEFDKNMFTRIRKVYYLNKSNILILLKTPIENKDLRLDWWVKKEGKWCLESSEYSSMTFLDGETYNRNKQPFSLFYQNMADFVYLQNNKFATINYPFYPIQDIKSYDQTNYRNNYNSYLQSNQVLYGITYVKINLD